MIHGVPTKPLDGDALEAVKKVINEELEKKKADRPGIIRC